MDRLAAVLLLTVIFASTALAQSGPPDGPPDRSPDRAGEPPPPPPGGGSHSCKLRAVYTLNAGTVKTANRTYRSASGDLSAILVSNRASLTVRNPTITTTGNSSSPENSSFYGLNAAVVAAQAGTVAISGGTVTTTGTGANGLFATGTGASISMTGGSIKATGDGGHGVMATAGGSLAIVKVNITTSGDRAAAIATDRGGGTITVTGGTMASSGMGSPGIYSTGDITVSDAEIAGSGAEAVVIEGGNSVTLTNTRLSGEAKCGVMIYRSFSGDAQDGTGTFTMAGGSLTASDGPLFFITNTNAVIRLKGIKAAAISGTLLNASAGRWGRRGSNGGMADFTADAEVLAGDLIADAISSITATLRNGTTLTGKIKNAALTMDSTSNWNVTGDSNLSSLTDSGGVSGLSITNIHGNGHDVYYSAKLAGNRPLGGKTYALVGGGHLIPR